MLSLLPVEEEDDDEGCQLRSASSSSSSRRKLLDGLDGLIVSCEGEVTRRAAAFHSPPRFGD